MRPPFLILLLVVAAAAAPKRPFSHKYHLTQVSSCENCHSAATESTKAEDNLIPDKSACVNCHDEVEIAGPRATAVDRFNHARHVKAGNPAPRIAAALQAKTYLGGETPPPAQLEAARDACTGCHHGVAESENVPRDKATRAHFLRMADCLVCHDKLNPPESCKHCHVAKTPNFRPPSHGPDFKDKHGEKVPDKAGCAVCHGRKIACKECH